MAFQIRYEGPAAVDKGRPRWSGSIQVRNGEFTYIPRNLCFDLLQAKIRLDGVDLFVDELQANTGNSDIHMKGRTRGLLTYFYRNPRRVGFNWELNSPWIDLNDFHSFLAPRRYQMPFPVQGPPKGSFGDQLEQVLARSLAHLEVNVDSLTYRKFASRNISAKVILGDKHITVPDFNIEHAGGNIKAKVSLQENLTGTEFKLQGSIQHVDVKKLFYGFENFGQKAIEAESLEGIFSAGVHLKGRFSNTGNLQPGSIGGQVDFELREGALIEYEPLMKVGRFVFKNRNLEELRFKRISNQLDLNEGTITIHPMLIESSALYLKLYGVYGIHGGTDIHLEIPLRNPQKDEMRKRKGLPIPQKNKGIVLYLRVQDQPDGSISIGWDDERGEGKTDSLWAP